MEVRGLRRAWCRGWREQRGQALVEFALIAPILLMILFGMIEFGRAFQAYQVITDAAREAARMAVVGETGAVTEAEIKKVAGNSMGRMGLTNCGSPTPTCVTVFPSGANAWDSDGPPTTGDSIAVQIYYPYRFVFLRPFMSWWGGQGQIILKTRVVFRKE